MSDALSELRQRINRRAHQLDYAGDGLAYYSKADASDDLTLLDALSSSEAKLAASEAEVESLRKRALEVIEPFAAFAEKAGRFVQGRADFGGSPIMPTKHFRLKDFEAARRFQIEEKR